MLISKYFDLFDYPLTLEEAYKWYFNIGKNVLDIKILDIKTELERLIQDKIIEEKDGYYFLAGRQNIIEIRKKREIISLKKISKAQKIGKILGTVPGVKMIAIVSNLGYLNAEDEADIDLFMVTAKNRIWSVRFWCVILMKLLRQRPNKKTAKNKICLSYFVTENNLNLEQTALKGVDVHLIYLLSQYLLIYDEDNYWQKYVMANKWINKYLINFDYDETATRFLIKLKTAWLKKMIGKTEFSFENGLYKNIQLAMMTGDLQRAMKVNDKKVIVNDQMLKLHTNDKRSEINSSLRSAYEKIKV